MKRGNVWWAYFHVDGVRHQRSTGASNRRIAEEIERKFRDEANLQRHQVIRADPKMTFGELTARFLANAQVKPHHVDRLKLLLPYFAEMQLRSITKRMAQEYRKARHRHKIVSDTTINRDVEVLRHILFWAVDEGILLANPLVRVRLERERRKARPVLAVSEELSLLKAASPHLREIIIAALDTGMRRGELLNQLWEHVDFNRRLLSVTKSKTAQGESREIPFTQRVLEILWRKRQPKGLVFTFQDRPIHRIKTAWRTAITNGLDRHFRFHDLRHTFNTRAMEAGVMQEVRKALMGHSSGEDVHSIYTHVELPLKRQAIARLEAWHAQQVEILRRGRKYESKAESSQTEILPARVVGLLPAGSGGPQEPVR